MAVAFRDYYDVLGIARTASEAEIKKAFWTLARTYHPDVAQDKVGAETKFKEINEANEVLSDPDKRRKYDELGANWNHPERQPRGAAEAGAEFQFDGTGFSDFFEQFFGSRGQPGGGFARAWETGQEEEHGAQRGRDIESDLLVTLAEVLHGATRTIRLQRTAARTGQTTTQTLQVKIPAGVREAQLIRLAGQGQEGTGGGASGNLYLRVKFASYPDFRVRGADLYHDLQLTPWEAVLGADVHVPTLDGTVSLKIPSGTRAGSQLRLRGKGLPAGDGTRGELYVTVCIQVPPDTTPEQRALWEQLAAASPFSPRQSA